MGAFIVFSITLLPFIYWVVSIIVDSITDDIKANNRRKYYGEEELFYTTTYQNKNVTEQDIMLLFII